MIRYDTIHTLLPNLGNQVIVRLRQQLVRVVEVRLENRSRALPKGVVHRAEVEERPPRRLVESKARVADQDGAVGVAQASGLKGGRTSWDMGDKILANLTERAMCVQRELTIFFEKYISLRYDVMFSRHVARATCKIVA